MFWDLVLRFKVERTIEIGKIIAKNGMEPEGYQNGAKTEPKRVQMEPKGCQKRPKWSPKGAQNGPNGAQRVPRMSQMATRGCPRGGSENQVAKRTLHPGKESGTWLPNGTVFGAMWRILGSFFRCFSKDDFSSFSGWFYG